MDIFTWPILLSPNWRAGLDWWQPAPMEDPLDLSTRGQWFFQQESRPGVIFSSDLFGFIHLVWGVYKLQIYIHICISIHLMLIMCMCMCICIYIYVCNTWIKQDICRNLTFFHTPYYKLIICKPRSGSPSVRITLRSIDFEAKHHRSESSWRSPLPTLGGLGVWSHDNKPSIKWEWRS